MTSNGERPPRLPRLITVLRGSTGFGFHLHCEKGRPGQFVRSVDDTGNAQRAGLNPGDRLVEVDSVSIDGMSHQDVVARIRGGERSTTLLVVDRETDDWYKHRGLPITVSDAGNNSGQGHGGHVIPGTPPTAKNVGRSGTSGGPTPGETSVVVRSEMAAALPQGKRRRGGHQKGGWAARAAAFDQL